MSRIAVLSPEEMDDAQRSLCEKISAGPRGGFRGPFHAWVRSPEYAERIGRMGEFLRYESCLPPRLRELAVLVVARFWRAQYAWYAHAPLAAKAGLGGEIISSLRERRRPASMEADEAAVYEFCAELQEKRLVSDATYRVAVERFGERGTVELTGLIGFYTIVAMTLNAFEIPVPEGAEPPLPE